jgi:hypothetical protein
MRTASRRTALIAACAFVIAFVAVLAAEWRHAARTATATEHAKEPLPDVKGATKGPGVPSDTAPQFESSAPATESTAVKPVVIGTVKPWTEIARMQPYVKASPGERMAIRDLYWRTCVEEKIPLEQRTPAYWQFVRSWEGIESGSPGTPSRMTYGQLQREQQPRVPSPIDAETMRRWCRTQAPGS